MQEMKHCILCFDDVAISGKQKRLAYARHFDLLHNSHLTVPMYAYRCELFVSSFLLPS